MTDNEQLAILQRSTSDSSLPKEIRIEFVQKVYGIVIAMLLLTFAISSPFVFDTQNTIQFMKAHLWILFLCFALLIVQHLLHLCMMLEMCAGSSEIFKRYIWMMKTVPWNFIYLFTYAAVLGVVVGIVCTAYTAQSVCVIFALSACIILGLTIYAVSTEDDLTGMGAYIVVLLLGLFAFSIFCLIFPIGPLAHRIFAGFGAIVYGFVIVYETQLIFGSASKHERRFEFTLDMYAFAAFDLYMDFINFFLYMLQALGERR